MIAGLCLLKSGDGEIRCEQLKMVTKWISDFQAASRQSDEHVVFDVLCGDFNFDNCSPSMCFSHSFPPLNISIKAISLKVSVVHI